MEDSLLYISAIQHFAYCPRQFALIHVEQVWADNNFTAEGNILHERVDSGEAEQRKALRMERSVQIKSERLGLLGKLDLLEIEKNNNKTIYRPVEYKRGKPKVQNWDRLQVCAQALCLEEMRSVEITEAAIWYRETRHREKIYLDCALREETEQVIFLAKEVMKNRETPSPTNNKKRCKGCSLNEICQPNLFRKDSSAQYVNRLFEQ